MKVEPDWREGLSDWPGPVVDFSLRIEQTCLVIVDVQLGWVDPDGPIGRPLQQDHPELHAYFYRRLGGVVVPGLARVLGHYRSLGLPIIHVTSGSARLDGQDVMPAHARRLSGEVADPSFRIAVGNRWHDIAGELAPRSDEVVLNKRGWSAFNSTEIDELLRARGVKQLVIGGVVTDCCVDLTARDAADLGYETFLLDDGCAAYSVEVHNATLRRFQRSCGMVVGAEHVLAEVGESE